MRIGHGLCLLVVCIATGRHVQEEVELDGKVSLDGVGAIACTTEGRLGTLALYPQIMTDAVAYLVVVNVRDKEVNVPVVDTARHVLDAVAIPAAFKQNLDDVPMVDILHTANLHIFFLIKKLLPKRFCRM